MLRVESSDFASYTEFEEGIHFDEDDPDFARQQDVMPSISLPLVLRVPTKMSLAGVHPAEVHSTHGSMTTLSHSLDDISGWPQMQTGGGNDHVLTIEELRLQLSSCFTCGVSWVEHHVSLDCSECGGYALERPCPRCDGHCGATWKRDLTMSHACGKARWQGECTYNNCTCPQNVQEPAKSNATSKTSAPANNALAQELCSRMAQYESTREVSISCEDDAGAILQPNMNLRSIDWTHTSSELITEDEVIIDQEEICESIEEIVVDQENVNYVTCLGEECMEESIVYVFEEPVVEFDLSEQHYIIDEPLTYDIEVAEEGDNMNSSSSEGTNKNESSHSVADEEIAVPPNEIIEASTIIIENVETIIEDTTKVEISGESVDNNAMEINKCESGIEICSTSKKYSVNVNTLSDSNDKVLQSHSVSAENSDCCELSEVPGVSSTVSPVKLTHSLYGDDDPVTNTFVATLSPSLTPKHDLGIVDEQKTSDDYDSPPSPRTPVLPNASPSVVTPPSMLPSVLNRNKLTPVKKPVTNLNLELPTPTEQSPVSAESNSKDSPLPGSKISVLGKEQIKKRLQSFSLLKQGIQPLPIKKIINVKQQKLQVQMSDEYDENGKKLDEKLVTIKKPPKQGSNPQEKAKAVINEIEQIKREEAARIENNYLLYHKHNYPTNSSYSIKDQTNSEHLLNKKTKAALGIGEKVLDDGSRTPPHKSYSSKDKKYGKQHSKSVRRKSSEGDKSEKKKHEHSKDERMPKDWAEVKKLNYEFKKIAKLKEKTLKSLIDTHKSPDKRSGNHKRSQEDDKNVNHKKDECTKPQLIFEYPSLPRHPLIALSVKGKSKFYPPEIVKYTEKYPTVSYCENPNHASGYYRTRKQVLSEIPAERSDLMLQIIENKIRTTETPECFVQNGSWYPAKEFLSESTQITKKECVISYGLSVLSQSYNDDGEENVDSAAEVLTEEKDLKTEETVKSDKDTNSSSKKSKKSHKTKHKSKSRSKSREKTDSQKKSSKSRTEEDTKPSSKSTNKIEEDNSTRSPPKPDVTEDKTPNTEEYRSNWESDEDLLTEIMRPAFNKPYHRSDSLDKKWDSEEEMHEKYDDKRKHDNKHVEKRRISSSERISEERNRRRSEDKRKSRNSFSLEERVSDAEERHSHASSKHSHQNVDHRKSSDFKHDIEDKPRRSMDHLACNKWSSEEDVNRSVSSKYDNRNKRNDSQKSEKKDSKERSGKHFEDLSSTMLNPAYNHRKSQWSEDEEFERRKIAAEFEKRSRHNYEGKLSKHDEIRMIEKEKQSKHDELRMLDRDKQPRQLQKIDDRLKSRWEEEFKQLETAKYRNKERHEDTFEKDPKDLLNLKEYERKHLYLEEFQEKSNRDDFEHRKSHKEDTKIDKYREEKSKSKEKKKYKDKKPKVTINYSDLEDNLDEEFRSDKKPKKELSLFKEETVTRARPKIKIDYSDFDMSLIESKDKFEENIYSRTLNLNASKVLDTSINFDVTKNIDVKERLGSVKATEEAKEQPLIIKEVKKSELKIEKKVVSNDSTPTKDETNIQIDSATPVKSHLVQTIPEVSPVAPPVLPTPVPSTKPNPPGDQLASAYEEFMKAVFANEPTEDTPEKSTAEVEQANEPKQKLERFEVSEKISTPAVDDKDSAERSEIPLKENSQEISASSNESSSESESSDSEDPSDESSDESSDTNSETSKSSDVNLSIKETVKNIKTEILSDSEKEYENERKVKSDKRKRCDKSDSESSNESDKNGYNLDIVIKSEKDNLKKTKKNDSDLEHVEHDESKYKNVIDWETSYSGGNTGYVDMFKQPEYLVPLKLPVIDITEMATSAVLPENIPLPNDFNLTTVQNISVVDAQLESPKHIPNILDPQTPSPKKSRSLIPIKLLTAENRKQANETANDLTKTIVTSSEISTNTTAEVLYENLEDTDLNLSRKRQSQWNMNLTPAKKRLLQNNVMGDDSDEDFTDKFIKQSEKIKPSDKDYPKNPEAINNDHFDIVSKDGENYVKLDYEKSKVEAEHKDIIKAAKHETDSHKEQESDKVFNKDSHDRSKHSPEHKVDKNSDQHRSDRRSSSVGKSDKRSSRRSSHERRDRAGHDSVERKRERSRERSNRESQRDRGRKRTSDRGRYSDRKPGLDKGRSRYSREKDMNRYRGRERSKERGRFRDQDRGRDRSVERGRDRSVERGRNRSPDRAGDRSMERGRDRSAERMGGDRSMDRIRDRSMDRIRDRSLERIRGSLDRTRERSPNRIRERTPERMRDRTPERMRDRTPERMRDRTPERMRDRTPERIRDRSLDRSTDRGRDRSPDMLRGRSPVRLRDRTPDRIMERGRSPNRLNDRSLDRIRDRSPDRFRDRSPERIMDRGMDRGRDRSPDRMRERSLERLRERSLDRYRERDHRDSDRYPPRRREDPRRYSRSPSPSRKERRSVENIPMPCRTMPDDTDFSATSMDIVHSPVNSPLDGFKRSLADSTISDSELIAQLNTPEESNEPLPAYSQMQYYPSVKDLKTSKSDLPSSPKRISLDDRINLVLGIEKEPPKQIDTVCTRGPYNNNNQAHYHDPYAYSRAEYDMYNVPPPGDLYGNSQYPNQYQHQPYYPNQLNHDNNIKVVQVGNVIQVVPTEQAVPPPPIAAPIPKVNELPSKVVQVGNMLQIVPMTMIDNTTVASPLATVSPATIPPAPVTPVEKLVIPKTTNQLALERRAEKEKRRLEREQRRKEKEKKRREKEKRKQLKNKLKTENMIKRALMLETGEGELDIINAEPDVLLSETTDSTNLPLAWPPASMLSTQPLPKPPAKGILVTHGFRREKEEGSSEDNAEPRRVVKFADGICPGEGTSPSGGEDLPSPPPPPPRKLPKEKRYKKLKNKNKKKIKVKIIRTQQPVPDEEEESEDNLPPPPPPPGSPPPHLWPPRIKQPPVNNIHPSLPGNVYPPNPYPPQQVMYPAAYPAAGPQQVPVIIGHAPPPPPQGSRHHHPPAMPVMQHGAPQHIGPPPQHVGPPPPHHATHHVPPPFHH